MNIGRRGRRYTVGLPGTGLSYTQGRPRRRILEPGASQAGGRAGGGGWLISAVIVGLLLIIFF